MLSIFKETVDAKYAEKEKRDIWENSPYKHIAELENDDVGKVGEKFLNTLCKEGGITASIDGLSTKKAMVGGNGDGIILGKTIEIKTARQGSSDAKSFQHEMGECPWNAEYMAFIDISPSKIYITVFKNFTQEHYMESGKNNSIKCGPVFPTKSICWRKQKGAFKLDTSVKINESNSHTFIITDNVDINQFREYITKIMAPESNE